MTFRTRLLNCAVATQLALAGFSGAAAGQAAGLDDLFDNLATASPELAAAIEKEIWEEWSKSGSPAMDLLLERGRTALGEGDWRGAVGHFTALTDHAPGFAEAWNGRATAYFQGNLYGPAMEDIAVTLRLNPRHFGAMSGLALILEETGSPEAALAVWREVVEIHPHAEGAAAAIDRLSRSVEGSDI